jgi:pyruvate/2-oxoglutarate dehydrogenase complex dihydrolipoamide acyltransferase (E2) component
VLAFVEARETAVPPVEASRMRQTIAERMTHSLRTAAHCHTFIEVEMSRLQAARTALGISPLPILARACMDAMRCAGTPY